MTIRIALIGFGKIAHDEHWPTIAADPAFTLVAVAGGRAITDARGPEVERFADARALLDWGAFDAVAICTPPGPRCAIARDCLAAGLDVLLEKPPTATPGELAELAGLADRERRVLFTAWHSQFAQAVPPARVALIGRRVTDLAVEWRENARRWHPGQDWVLAAGGFGVFDAGINALSIVTAVLPETPLLRAATLSVPAGRGAPIAATLDFAVGRAVFDWRSTGSECRRIAITTDTGTVELTDGGMALSIDGVDQQLERSREYPPLYARFAELVATQTSQVDAAPLQIVTDALRLGVTRPDASFDW